MLTADATELAEWRAGRRRLFRVAGQSMTPALADGDEVLVDPIRSPRVGDIAVARHPFRTDCVLIKRVESIADGKAMLVGDNPGESTDSRTLGAIPMTRILGIVTSRLPQTKADPT